MIARASVRLIQLSRAQWLILGAFVGIVFPLLMLLAFYPLVDGWYTTLEMGPELERDLGFRAAMTSHPAFPGRETFHITEVRPGGIFDRAGIRAGDIPLHIHHGPADFYRMLEAHRGRRLQLRIVRVRSGPSDTFPVGLMFEVLVPGTAV